MKIPKKPQTIGIIGGRGRMGAFFDKLFEKDGYTVLISDKRTKLSNIELAGEADVVIVTVPIAHTEKVINEITPYVRKDALLADFTGLKEIPVKAMLKSNAAVIGLHPMFNDAGPIAGQTVIACPARPKKWYPWVKDFFQKHGAKIIELKPKEHDKTMAVVQAFVHFADIAFGKTLKDLKIPVTKYLQLASPASDIKIAFVARLLAQDPDLYASMEMYNPYALKILRKYGKSVRELIKINKNANQKKFVKYFNDATSHLKNYEKEAYEETNFIIHSVLERRKRTQDIERIKKGLSKAEKSDLAVLGPKNTYTDLAAKKYDKKASIVYYPSIADVFDAISEGRAKKGVVPLENLINGTVRETFDELFNKNVKIIDKIILPIRHSLVALNGVKPNDIDTISSHDQALQQCRKILQKKYPTARRIPNTSTIAALSKIIGQRDGHSAAIIPTEIAKKMSLNILDENIGDSSENNTTFIIIEKGSNIKPKEAEGKTKTAIAFKFRKDKPGSLIKILENFAANDINLTRIESRPSRHDIGNYIFYLDFEGTPFDKKAKQILKNISKKVEIMKILGVY
ncbi:prephenate dehydratase [Candidatus Peregrinibacteria bacterium]|nr:prephenate dehydratase [Candidatus Peregrinibacteria bacterium]